MIRKVTVPIASHPMLHLGVSSLAWVYDNSLFGGTAPILEEGVDTFSNPLPHVLILTAIVVSVSTMAVALAIIVNIKRDFGTIESDELLELEQQDAA